ncbi:hypothetical protein C0993_010962, partial [Termitomyces sp. T159_Od127]
MVATMMASLLSAAPSAGRPDASLPTVKCSNCNRPVPLSDLSDHVCAAAPTLPKPALSPAAAVSLLPQRLQDRLVSPASPRTSNDARLGGASSSDRLRIGTGSMYQSRISHPATPNEVDRAPSPYQRSLHNPSPAPTSGSVSTPPLRTRAGTVAGTIGRRPSNLSAASYDPPPVSSPATARPSFSSSRDAGPSHNSGPLSRNQIPSPPQDPSFRASPGPQYPEPDTQTGGKAGMAGVGRRGFAAAARAAMFLTPGDQLHVPQPRRSNGAPYLDTDLPRHINETPPLSAGSSQSPGVSPYPQSPIGYHGLPYPDRYDTQVPPLHQVTPSLDRGLTPSPSPFMKFPFDKDGNQLGSAITVTNTLIDDNRGLETPLTAKQQYYPSRSPREPETSIYLYNQSVTTRSVSNSTNASRLAARRPPSSSDSHSDYESGLAYADNTDHEDEEPQRKSGAKNPSVSSLTRSEWKEKEGERKLALEPKIPTRTKSESMSGSGRKERVKKPKVCLKCNEMIENGRWIATESGSVLCERCWKHMYLPKCRRCDLPIENAAVSSADGQLRGKYHRECFNCYVCHKSFPDKSFYVFDGKPLCKYHYHEANESLCAATLCGQPIEGPCAVSHTGDRTKLAEYWEVDGRMLCERHAHTSEVESDGEQAEE